VALDQITSILKLAAPFSALSLEQLKLIAFVTDERVLEANDVLFHEGELADGAYILVSGALRASHHGAPMRDEEYTDAGATIGELALLVEKPRPSTVTVIDQTQLLFVPRQHFKRLIENYPDLAISVSDRIKKSMQSYVGALAKARV